MGNFGRYVCVAIPFAMTLASLVAILIGGLGGVIDKNMFMFEVNATDFTISSSQVSSLLNGRSPGTPTIDARQATTPTPVFHDPAVLGGNTGGGINVTGQDIGIYDLYDVGLWGYCYTAHNGTRTCTKTAFNWAEHALNQTTSNVNSLITASGKNVTLPSDITDGLKTFEVVLRWTEIVFIIACVSLGVELFFGLFANCSRAFSCVTFLVAGVATVAVCAFAAMATATSAIVVGVIESTAKFYGVHGSFNTHFLIAIWIGAAAALAAGFFWMFTCCCCAPDHHSSRRNRNRDSNGDREKLVPSNAYVPIVGDGGAYNNSYGRQQFHYASGANAPAARHDMAYEPYAHHANV